MRQTTCLNCLSFTSHPADVKVKFCFKCGKPMPTIPDDAHKDFMSDEQGEGPIDLNKLTRQELQKMKTESMNDLVEYISGKSEEISKNVKRFNQRNKEVPDWEKKDWFQKLKKLKF